MGNKQPFLSAEFGVLRRGTILRKTEGYNIETGSLHYQTAQASIEGN